MNKKLADAIAFINVLLAVLVVLSCAIAGAMYGGFGGFLGGLLAGALAAILVCGMLALIVDVRNELVKIRNSLERSA